jgi:uncharacterized YccA/Bax inhibitor family protein
MSAEVLNDQIWTSPQVEEAFPDRSSRMSVNGVIAKSMLLLMIVIALAAVGWHYAPQFLDVTSSLWFLVGYFLLIGLTLMVVRNPALSLIVGLVFAIINGLWIGAISQVYEEAYDGVVAQALLGTVAVAAAVLLLFLFVPFRATSRFVKIVFSLTLGIGMFYLIAWFFSLLGGNVDFLYGTSPLATFFSLFFMTVAAANLVVDFTYVDAGVKAGAPRGMEWFSAVGIVSTLVWLYMEILRFLAARAARSGGR